MIDKARSRQIRVEICDVLLRTWDPIGVQDEPNAQDENDEYIGKICDPLAGGAPDSDLVDYLFWEVYEHMGLDAASREDMFPTVVKLRKINLSPVDSHEGSNA
jgi:hypothetical protein